MAKTELAGKAQTVLGPIDPKDLGITLPHEHLFIAHGSANFVEPSTASEKGLAYKPVSMEILNWLHHHCANNIDNMNMLDEQEAIDEAMIFKRAGGGTIVDVTNVGIGRDPKALARISRATGLNIIMGAGYYLSGSHPKNMSEKTEEEITEEIVHDVTVGTDGTGICAGIIGEIGGSWPLLDNERKSFRAAARAQKLTGAPLTLHPGRKNNVAALELVEIVRDAGADMKRVIIDHIDNRVRDHSARREIAKAGCYLEYDVFGWEGYVPLTLYKDSGIELPNDSQRIDEVMKLIEEGFLKQILFSQDVCFKVWRVCYGGKGYAHILNNAVPLMLSKGMTQEQINTIMVENPKRILTFV
ncbi:phosphotriesterase [Chloroflexota bacterium]